MELSIPASPASLAGLRRAVRGCLSGVADEVTDDIVLAFNEVATNAIVYGSGAGEPVQVAVHVSDDCVEVSVLDHGPQPPAEFPETGDTGELAGRGRGLWLLRRLVDELRLERVQHGTRVTLRRQLGPTGTLTG
jgi:anti-sigma regulatory factor (Ser/Thr protein kinase)